MRKSIRVKISDSRSDQSIDVNWAPEKRMGSVARKCAKLFGHPVVGVDWRLKFAGKVFSPDVRMEELPVGYGPCAIHETGQSV